MGNTEKRDPDYPIRVVKFRWQWKQAYSNFITLEVGPMHLGEQAFLPKPIIRGAFPTVATDTVRKLRSQSMHGKSKHICALRCAKLSDKSLSEFLKIENSIAKIPEVTKVGTMDTTL